MTSRKAPKNPLPHDFPIKQSTSVDRNTQRLRIFMPRGWRFNSLNTSEGRVRLTFKRATAARKAGRLTGYARDRQRLTGS